MLKFDYVTVRYTPSAIRQETVNIGIIVLNDKLDIRLLKSASKIRILDNDSSVSDIIRFSDSLEKLTQKIEDPKLIFSMFGKGDSGISFSGLGSFTLSNKGEYNDKVESLFKTLVIPYPAKESGRKNPTRITTKIKERFRAIEILAENKSELSEHKVVPNFVLNEQTGMTADFLLKNSIYHLTEAIDYNVSDTKGKFKETSLKLMTFAEGKRALEDTMASYFVYSATASNERLALPQINLAEEYSDEIFNLDSREDEARYFSLIEKAVGRRDITTLQ